MYEKDISGDQDNMIRELRGGILCDAGLSYVKNRPAVAARFWERGAALGNETCISNLVIFYHNDPTRDNQKALEWAQRLAEVNEPQSDFELARIYETGLGVPKDTSKATAYLNKAAEAGHPRAMGYLGYIYKNGLLGLSKDEKLAMEWLEKAAAAGDPPSKKFIQDRKSSESTEPRSLKIRPTVSPTASPVADLQKIRDRLGVASDDEWEILKPKVERIVRSIKAGEVPSKEDEKDLADVLTRAQEQAAHELGLISSSARK